MQINNNHKINKMIMIKKNNKNLKKMVGTLIKLTIISNIIFNFKMILCNKIIFIMNLIQLINLYKIIQIYKYHNQKVNNNKIKI